MQCPHCGRELPDGSEYCDRCGAFLGEGGAASSSGAGRAPHVGGGSGSTPGGYVRHYDPIDTTGPDSTDVMRPVTPVDPVVAGQDSDYDPLAGGMGDAHGIRARHADERPERPDDDRMSPLAVVFAVLLGIVALALFVLLFRSCAAQMEQGGSGEPAAETEAATADAATDEAATDEGAAGEVEVRASLGDYSWDELSRISDEVASAQSWAEAEQIASGYNLMRDGSFPDDTKLVELSDGTTIAVRLADIRHDDRADGSGKAGLTFVTVSVCATHRLEPENSNAGGWEGSEMRSWMNSESGLLGELPEDLRDNIVEVSKLTNNTGHSTSTDCVTATSDSLWLLSLQEVAGDVSWSWASDPGNSSAYNAIMNAEGTQYELFFQQNVDDYHANAFLQLADADGTSQTWWLRSSSVSVEDHFRKVNKDGDPSQFDDPSIPYGVVFGFCL